MPLSPPPRSSPPKSVVLVPESAQPKAEGARKKAEQNPAKLPSWIPSVSSWILHATTFFPKSGDHLPPITVDTPPMHAF
jgi:hypothetical protein